MRAVIFDLGRVLIDYNHDASLDAVAALSQVTPVEIRALFQAIAGATGIGELDAEQIHRYFVEQAGVPDDFGRFIEAFGAGLTRNEAALSYAVELQQRPGVTVGVISNTNQAHILWLDAHLPELAQLDLVMMSSEVGMAKPDPAIYELALELLNLPAGQAIFVDDLTPNVIAAQGLGMAGIVHASWETTRPALEAWLVQPV